MKHFGRRRSPKDRSRLKLGLWITLAAVLLALTATPLVWASRQSAAYRRLWTL